MSKNKEKNTERNKEQNEDLLKEKVEKQTTEQKLKETEEKLLRSLAEIENQRRRFEKEIKDALNLGLLICKRKFSNIRQFTTG